MSGPETRHRLLAVRGAVLAGSLVAAATWIGATAFGASLALERAPVQQLPPGRITLATVKTVQGPVVIALHRIRYLGKVALCMSESNESDGGGTTGQSCANYPLGPKSNQPIGNSPVWWTTYIGACTSHHFQVISGVVLRSGLTAWLHTPSGISRMPSAAIPRGFDVAGDLAYALISTTPVSVSLRNGSGTTVYAEPVEPLPHLPTAHCTHSMTSVFSVGPSGNAIP
jgi:hypothetical protein